MARSSATEAQPNASGAPSGSAPLPSGALDAGPGLPPLAHERALLDLPVAGFEPAVVSLPLGATAARPVALATHGNYDRPEWQCQEWRQVIGDRAFVLCPRGSARADSPSRDDIRFTYASNAVLEREIDAGLEALRARFPGYVADGPVLYTGFSLGAIMGVAIATRQPARYPILVLVEGGADWTWTQAKGFAAGGGTRVLFASTQKGSAIGAREAARKLQAVKVQTQQVELTGLGHSYGGPLNEPIQRALPWLLQGDDRWDLDMAAR